MIVLPVALTGMPNDILTALSDALVEESLPVTAINEEYAVYLNCKPFPVYRILGI